MKRWVRWLLAVLVTIVAFVVPALICGILVLPTFMKDGNIRWGVATAVGLALAALAALWGQSFATAEASNNPAHGTSAVAPTITTGSGGTSNEITGGNFHGPVIQGRDISGSGIWAAFRRWRRPGSQD